MKTATKYLVRRMRMADIPQVMEIEKESFPTMWPPTAFKRELQQNRLAHYIVISERNPSYMREDDRDSEEEREAGPIGRILDEIKHIFHGDESENLPPPEQRAELVVGVVGLWMMPDEAHIVTIATRLSHRRHGIGEMLLISAIGMAQERGQPMVTLEVRVSNEAAIAMYAKYGLVEVGRRARYYSDNHEDAFILTVTSVLTPRYGEEFEKLRLDHGHRWGDFDFA